MRRNLICFDYPIQAYKVRLAKYPGDSLPTMAELRLLDRVLINKDIRMSVEYDGKSDIPLASDVQFVDGFVDLNDTLSLLRPETPRSSESTPSQAIAEASAIPSSSSVQPKEEEQLIPPSNGIVVDHLIMTDCKESASSSDAPNFGQAYSVLVSVTRVIDPGLFYIVRWCERGELDLLSNTLNDLGPVFQVPGRIVIGQMYAALNSAGQWTRALVEHLCGTVMVF